jgi:hypothetical protein
MGNAHRQAANSKLHHRKTTTSGGIGDWTIVQISYSTEVTLNKQPLGKQLEYRIRAANNAGTSPPQTLSPSYCNFSASFRGNYFL